EANGRALQKVYGPRKVRVLNDRASLLREADRSEEARASAAEALALIRSLPEGQRARRAPARAEKLLSELPARGVRGDARASVRPVARTCVLTAGRQQAHRGPSPARRSGAPGVV